MATTYAITFELKGQTKVFSRFTKNGVKFVPFCRHGYAKFNSMADAESAMHRIISFANVDNVVIRQDAELQYVAMRNVPICTFIDYSKGIAAKYDVKCWHHLHFFADKCLAIVWDSRLVDQCIPLSEFTDEDFANLKFEYTDNLKGVKWLKTAPFANSLRPILGQPTAMTIDKFNLIKH